MAWVCGGQVTQDRTVVVYDAGGMLFATRLWLPTLPFLSALGRAHRCGAAACGVVWRSPPHPTPPHPWRGAGRWGGLWCGL